MFSHEFEYTSNVTGQKSICKIEQDDEVLNITINGKYLGTMTEDLKSEFGFVTNDEDLKPELEGLSMYLREDDNIRNLPNILYERYGQSLTAWTWTDNEDLKLIAHPEMDLTEFAHTIRDQIYDFVTFDKPLTIYLGQEGSSNVEEIFVN